MGPSTTLPKASLLHLLIGIHPRGLTELCQHSRGRAGPATTDMQKVSQVRTTVLLGGKKEIVDEGLPVRDSVDVVARQSPASEHRSIADTLDETPGHLIFTSAADVAAYPAEEEDAWGPLTLPTAGSVYIDANAIVYSMERIEPYRKLLVPMWEEAGSGRFALASSELVVLETLIKLLREGNVRLEMLYDPIIAAAEMDRELPWRLFVCAYLMEDLRRAQAEQYLRGACRSTSPQGSSSSTSSASGRH